MNDARFASDTLIRSLGPPHPAILLLIRYNTIVSYSTERTTQKQFSSGRYHSSGERWSLHSTQQTVNCHCMSIYGREINWNVRCAGWVEEQHQNKVLVNCFPNADQVAATYSDQKYQGTLCSGSEAYLDNNNNIYLLLLL